EFHGEESEFAAGFAEVNRGAGEIVADAFSGLDEVNAHFGEVVVFGIIVFDADGHLAAVKAAVDNVNVGDFAFELGPDERGFGRGGSRWSGGLLLFGGAFGSGFGLGGFFGGDAFFFGKAFSFGFGFEAGFFAGFGF